MIKVLHYGLSSHLGGIETYIYKITRFLEHSQFEFSFIWEGDQKPCYYDRLKDLGCRFYRITRRRENPVQNKKDLIHLFQNNAFDIFHCHLNTLSYITPVKIAAKHNCRIIIHSRSSYADSTNFYSIILHRWNFNWLFKREFIRIAVSDKAAKWIFGNKKAIILNNGIDTERFRFRESERAYLRNKLGLKDKRVYGHIGSFISLKNHLFLLEVFNEIVQKDKSAYLILLGKGNQENNIKQKIHQLGIDNYVFLAGSKLDVERYLWAMDVLIFPSKFEGFPNVVLEAQTAGLPCLMADTITKEVIVLKSTIAKSLDADQKEWAETAEALGRMNINRVECADKIEEAGFSVQQEIKKIEEIYRGCL